MESRASITTNNQPTRSTIMHAPYVENISKITATTFPRDDDRFQFHSGTKTNSRLTGIITNNEVKRQVDEMDISRAELEARLAQNKAEVESVAAVMKQEMAQWREQNVTQLSALNASIQSLSSKIDGKMDSVDGEVKAINGTFSGLQGQITGINSAISGIQSGISTRLAIFGFVIAVIVALPGLLAFNKNEPLPQQNTSPPVIIQVPQQLPQPLTAPMPPAKQ